MAPPTLSVDEIDELVYLARANEIADFKNEIEGLVKGKESSVAEIVKSAIDEESGNGVLHYASANGHAEILEFILKAIPSEETNLSLLSTRNSAGNTPLHWAALNGHLTSVQCLIEHGADPYLQNKAGHDAIYEAELNDRREAVEWMLKEGGLEEEMEDAGADAEGDAEVPEINEEDLKRQLEGMDLKAENEAEGKGKGKGKGKAE